MIAIARLGARTLDVLRGFGRAAWFFADLVRNVPGALRRLPRDFPCFFPRGMCHLPSQFGPDPLL